MQNIEFSYLGFMQKIIDCGSQKFDRTGIGTSSIFGVQMRHNMACGFPLLTTKKVFFKGIIHELLWFLKGDTNVEYLQKNGVHIWDEWATAQGDLGPIYGKMWRSWPTSEGSETIDQIANVIDALRNRPDSRRLVVSSWNPTYLPNEELSAQENVEAGRQALPPCHTLFQFYSEPMTVRERLEWAKRNLSEEKFTQFICNGIPEFVPSRSLSLHIYQRSGDWLLGIPFNIASYSALLLMVAEITGMAPKDYIHTIGDAHIYNNYRSQCHTQLLRAPRTLPSLKFGRQVRSIDDFEYVDFNLEGYDAHPPIRAEVAV